jgi:hypothetical protein
MPTKESPFASLGEETLAPFRVDRSEERERQREDERDRERQGEGKREDEGGETGISCEQFQRFEVRSLSRSVGGRRGRSEKNRENEKRHTIGS